MNTPNDTMRFALLGLLVAITAAALFLPGLPGEFVFDDFHNIVNNRALHLTRLDADALAQVLATAQVSGPTRILPTLSFAADYWRGGADPMVFKTTNLLIHALTAFALGWFFRSLLALVGVRSQRASWLGLALAFAWAAHPLQVSAVLYTVQRIQTMGTLFLVLALWSYLQARQAQLRGQPARTGLVLTLLLWALAMACKEDSILLPAYTLALELTVLRFAATDARVAERLKRGYLIAAAVGAAAYILVVIPHFWHWETLPGRDFSTLERLLTQPRVLCMHLWQILAPLPGNMPFYYDWLQPSRSLLQPWTTLPAIAAIVGLLGIAWSLRVRWPLFSLGVFLFFASHFVTSNVVPLEMVFEHRNHFGLIGALLAVGSLLTHAGTRLGMRPGLQTAACTAALVALAGGTVVRAHAWGSSAAIARIGTEAAPGSGRAWVQLCASQFRAGGGAVPGNPRLDLAIQTCRDGADAAPQALNSLTLLVVLKTLRGDDRIPEWDLLQQRMRSVRMTSDNTRVFTILLAHARNGVDLDKQELLELLPIVLDRGNLGPVNRADIGYFVMNHLGEPDLALPYFIKSIEARPANDPFPLQIGADLRAMGRRDLADTIEMFGSTHPPSSGSAPDGAQ
jgi:hypothetical protein